jgi:hypothetical protein
VFLFFLPACHIPLNLRTGRTATTAMRSPAAAARLLTTLSHPSPHSPLLPPYAQQLQTPGSAPSRALSPPYAHSTEDAAHIRKELKIKAAKKFVLLEKEVRYELEWRSWLEGLVGKYGEERIWAMWEECVKGVQGAKRDRVSEMTIDEALSRLSALFDFFKSISSRLPLPCHNTTTDSLKGP